MDHLFQTNYQRCYHRQAAASQHSWWIGTTMRERARKHENHQPRLHHVGTGATRTTAASQQCKAVTPTVNKRRCRNPKGRRDQHRAGRHLEHVHLSTHSTSSPTREHHSDQLRQCVSDGRLQLWNEIASNSFFPFSREPNPAHQLEKSPAQSCVCV